MERRYEPALDGLRAIGAIAVLAFHCGLLSGGFLGVDVFFVLSGFLITRNLRTEIERETLSVPRFYLRRAKRLLPAFCTMLCVYLVALPILAPQISPAEHVRDAVLSATYLTDWTMPTLPLVLRHTWTLAVEWQFYLLWPLVLPLILRFKPAIVLAAIYALITVHRALEPSWGAAFYHPDMHASGLVLGALLTFLPDLRLGAWPGLAIIGVAFLTNRMGAPGSVGVGIIAAEVGCALAVLAGMSLLRRWHRFASWV